MGQAERLSAPEPPARGRIRPGLIVLGLVAFGLGLLLGVLPAFAAAGPSVAVDLGSDTDRWSTGIQLVILFTLLSFAPAMLIGLSAFVRIVIVLSFVRQAVGTQQMPPNQVILALSCVSGRSRSVSASTLPIAPKNSEP